MGSIAAGLAVAVLGPVAQAHIDRASGHVRTYAYSASNCASKVDPIQVVFFNAPQTGSSLDLGTHFGQHGGWSTDDPDWFPGYKQQYYYDHGCSQKDGERSTSWALNSRYHARWQDMTNSANWDSFFGHYALATPHYEDITDDGDCDSSTKPFDHAIRENNSSSMPEGGYINAKHTVDHLWTYNWPGAGGGVGQHKWHGTQNWDNVDWMWQCDGQAAWGNGIVDFIRSYHGTD
jgi:hypothetical protein